eukprot:TRINITY_DN2448_c0_g1_i1.p1 TRINITY_DN2448_c0_g1~~TRINITY_DN2448_c0_g1_i1.p1  ORF type:complete len:276 (-),score=46.45 TRINITY_DN2448_c0_g1_i1:336-1163(-)
MALWALPLALLVSDVAAASGGANHLSLLQLGAERRTTSNGTGRFGEAPDTPHPVSAREAAARDHRGFEGAGCLVLNHLEKAAGSLVREMMRLSVTSPWRLEEESDVVEQDDLDKDRFVIGLTRNPLEWYLSLWAWSAHHERSYLHRTLPEYFPNRTEGILGDTPGERELFRAFVRYACSGPVGKMSARTYHSYLDVPSKLQKKRRFNALETPPDALSKLKALRPEAAISQGVWWCGRSGEMVLGGRIRTPWTSCVLGARRAARGGIARLPAEIRA